jgi:hypothetical protein
MSEIERSVNYAKKRSQALRNCEIHLQATLFDVAKKVVSASKKYRVGGRLRNESSFLSDAKNIAATASNDIESYTGAYAKASCKILGIDTDNIESFLVGDIYGKTLNERNTTYLSNFAEDIARMVKAGTMMGYSDSQLLSAIRTGYKDPYHASVVTKAQKKDINIATPSYGKGVFRNAYQNIVRNSKQVISIAWGQAEQEYGQEIGAIGFKVFRGSSYPCETCQNEVDAGVHSFRDPYPPFHVGCVCYTQFVFKDNKTKQL